MEELWEKIEYPLNRTYSYISYVSNLGNVKKVFDDRAEEEVNITYNKGNGYYYVRPYGGFKISLHRLVAMYFCKNVDLSKQVNHIDGDKSNNKAINLEWVTCKENMIHASEHNLINRDSEKRKEQCKENAKRSYEVNVKPIVQLDDNLNKLNEYESIKLAEEATGLKLEGISRAMKRNLRIGGYKWVYKEIYDSGEYLNIPDVKHNNKFVLQIDLEGNIINRFNSLKEAEAYGFSMRNELGLKKTSKGSIRRAVKDGSTYLDFYWVYEENYNK